METGFHRLRESIPQRLKPEFWLAVNGTTEEAAEKLAFRAAEPEEAAEKRNLPKKQRPQGLKPALISRGLRGPEGAALPRYARISESFRSL